MSKVEIHKLVKKQPLLIGLTVLLLVAGLLRANLAFGAELPSRSIQLNQALVGASDSFTLSFTLSQSETLGSVKLRVCSEGSLIDQPCSLPAGMDISSIALSSQTGVGDFTLSSVSGTDIILSRTPSVVPSQSLSFSFTGITNPSSAGSYFGRILTYPTNDGTGANTDFGGLAFAITESINITTTVPPYLIFCVGIAIVGVDCTTANGNYIDFGSFTPQATSIAQTQMVAGTNADTGYFIQVNGNTLTAGNNIIPGLTTNDLSRPGTSQFGMNLVANSDPQVGQLPSGQGSGQPTANYKNANSFRFVSGETVASSPLPDDTRKYTTSYIANVAKNQAPGIYVTTLTYVATAGF